MAHDVRARSVTVARRAEADDRNGFPAERDEDHRGGTVPEIAEGLQAPPTGSIRPGILDDGIRPVEFADIREIEAVLLQVGLPLRFVPDDLHDLM